MNLKKTLVMVLAACLLVGTLAGTAFAGPTLDVTDTSVEVVASGYSTVEGQWLPWSLDPVATGEGFVIRGYDAWGTPIVAADMYRFTGWMLTQGGNWGYYSNGVRVEGWRQIDGKMYFFVPGTGFMVQRGTRWIDGRLCLFDDQGVWTTTPGFYLIQTYFYVWDGDLASPTIFYPETGVARFYLNENGYVETGWHNIGGYYYMFDRDWGYALTNRWYQDDFGYWYYFDEMSHMVTGWMTTVVNGYNMTYFFNDSDQNGFLGAMCWGWLNWNGDWYYLSNRNGARIESSWAWINGFWYLFDEDGKMVTGWKRVALNPGAKPEDLEFGWFYFYPWGAMAIGDVYLNPIQNGFSTYHFVTEADQALGGYWINGLWYPMLDADGNPAVLPLGMLTYETNQGENRMLADFLDELENVIGAYSDGQNWFGSYDTIILD